MSLHLTDTIALPARCRSFHCDIIVSEDIAQNSLLVVKYCTSQAKQS